MSERTPKRGARRSRLRAADRVLNESFDRPSSSEQPAPRGSIDEWKLDDGGGGPDPDTGGHTEVIDEIDEIEGTEVEERPARGPIKLGKREERKQDTNGGRREVFDPLEPPTNGERDNRMKSAVEAARAAAEERATAEILALEKDLERERERAAQSLEDVQRRLEEAETRAGTATVTDAREDAAEWLREQRDEVTGKIEQRVRDELDNRHSELIAECDEAAAALSEAHERVERVEGAEVRLTEEATRLQGQASERVAAEAERIRAQADKALHEAVDRVEAETEERMREEAERRLREQKTELNAEADERVRVTAETVREETERRATRAEQKATKAEDRSLDAEVDARAAAAEWLRDQAKGMESQAQRAAREQVSAEAEERREETEKAQRSAEQKAKRAARDARREAEQAADAQLAEREGELVAELEEAGKSLRSAELQLREAEERASSAERRLGEVGSKETRERDSEREARFLEIEERIGAVTSKASAAQARAAASEIKVPELPGAEPAEGEPEMEDVDIEEPASTDGWEAAEAPDPKRKSGAKAKASKAKPPKRAKAGKAGKAGKARKRKKATSKSTSRPPTAHLASKARWKAKPNTEERELPDTAVTRPPKSSAKGPRREQSSEETEATPIEDARSARRGTLDVNEATFEQLRNLGMSVTQATRVIAYRERQDGFEEIDDIDTVPGFPEAFLTELKQKLSA